MQDAVYNWKVVKRIYVGKNPIREYGHIDAVEAHRTQNSGRYTRAEAPTVGRKAMRQSQRIKFGVC